MDIKGYSLSKLMSKFRLGLLRLRLETGRYIRPRMAPEDRVCLICNNANVRINIYGRIIVYEFICVNVFTLLGKHFCCLFNCSIVLLFYSIVLLFKCWITFQVFFFAFNLLKIS